MTKAVFDNLADLVAVHPEAKNISAEAATDTGEVELHPGAKRYFDEA